MPRTEYDVAVVGLGGVGSAAAWHLARAGRTVIGFDRFRPPHDRGSSHGRTRLIRQVYAEHPAYVPLAQRAYELWRAAEKEADRVLLTVTGGLTLGTERSGLVRGAVRAAGEWGLPYELLDAGQIRSRFPALRPAPDTVAVLDPRAGAVRPEAAVETHLGLAGGEGAALHIAESVLGWEPAGDRVRVRTEVGDYTAEFLVVCCGAWAPQLLPELDVPLDVERQVQFWFRPRDPAPFRPDRQPVLVWEYNDAGAGFYSVPVLDDAGEVKVAFHHQGRSCSPDSLDRVVAQDEIDAIEATIDPLLPDLAGRFTRAEVCMYTNTPDRHFVIGRQPGHDNVVLACGFSGHGFKFVPVLGEIIAELVTQGSTRWPVGLFAPDRATPGTPTDH